MPLRVSIVTLSYNQAEFLAEAMDSVLSQSHADIDYVVVDPGSTDGSLNIIKQRRDRLSAFVTGADRSPPDGLNRGFAAASGEIFGFLNSDDRLLPGALATVAKAFADDPSLDILSGHMRIIDRNGLPRRLSYTDRYTRRGMAYGTWNICQQSTFFRASLFRQVGGFNPDHRVSWDYDLMVRMFLQKPRHRIIDTVMSDFRIYDQSITGGKKFEGHREAMFDRHFRQIMGRDRQPVDAAIRYGLLALKYLREPRALSERLRHGSIFHPR